MLLHSWQLQDTPRLAVHHTAAGCDSLIHEAAQHLQHPAASNSSDQPYSVLNTLLTNFDVSQLLYKLLPRVASWTTL